MSNKEVARRLYEEVISGRRLELLDELVAEDAVDETSGAVGREAFRSHIRNVWQNVADVRAVVTDLVAEEDRVVVFWQMSGVHRGPLFGAPPSGRAFTGQSISWISFRDGQIIRYNVLPDRLGILRQLTGP
jgi:steroid delta-isomerase-like uncharacterized protein